MAASMKFLIPFSLLVAIGGQMEWDGASAIAKPRLVSAVGGLSQPFQPASTSAPSSATSPESVRYGLADSRNGASIALVVVFGIWLCGAVVMGALWFREWRKVRASLADAVLVPFPLPIRALSSPDCIEPGVFGIFRPVLVLPEGITDRLTESQFAAILAHELCHAKRRDNLAAAMHMVVETMFWFHPLVWWLERQLVAERERACDEEVLRSIEDPEVYAQGILNVCKFYKESPLACVSGVTGSNLKNRIEEIMTHRIIRNLTPFRKALLAIVGLAAVALPIGFGMVSASQTPSRKLITDPQAPRPEPVPTGSLLKESSQATGANTQTQGWLDQIEAAGYRNLDVEQLIRLKEHEIDGAYIQEIRAAGYDLPVDQLIRFREHEITAEFINGLKALGFKDLNANEVVRLREHDADPERIRQFQSSYPNVSIDNVIRLLEHDITPEYIREANRRFKDINLDQLIRIKEHDILPTR